MHWFGASIQQRMTVTDAGDADIAGLDWFIRAINLHHAGAVKNYVEFLVILVKMFADAVAGLQNVVMVEFYSGVIFLVIRQHFRAEQGSAAAVAFVKSPDFRFLFPDNHNFPLEIQSL
jgi:hypothetical protein